jgi:hypothetical protein
MRRGTRALLPRGHMPAPGVRLPPGAASEVRQALRRHAHGEAVIVFSEGEGVEIVALELLVARYRRNGCRELVVRLGRAVVPRGFVLGLVDAERGTRVVLLELETLLGAAALVDGDDRPLRCGTRTCAALRGGA